MSNDIGPFSTATAMLAALRTGAVSSSELTEMHIERIERLDGPLNAIPVRTFDRAREAASEADARRKRGEDAPLLGLPMTLKESEQVAGLPQTAGIPDFKDYRAQADGAAARATLGNGAALLGKTNIPVALGDWQADSPIYGRTNNPWDLSRTPGGSTGGGGAALAAGLTPLEVGSDIGGSIRVPAAYCGVWGHRPSETAIPRSGAFPQSDHPNPVALMGVQGPLARSARDLELLFDLMAGPDAGEDAAWRLEIPPSRHAALADFRVAVMPRLPLSPLADEVAGKVDELCAFLSKAGARVEVAMPSIDLEPYFRDYVTLLQAVVTQAQPREEREARAADLRKSGEMADAAMADGLTIDFSGLSMLLRRREAARIAWREFFSEWDVLIGPMTMTTAFPHAEGPFDSRVLSVDGNEVPYFTNIVYPMLAIFAGQPSTAFPAGLGAASGLPVGLQAIGPYLEDRTPIRFAQLLEEQWRGFTRPPGY
jgi:amidase